MTKTPTPRSKSASISIHRLAELENSNAFIPGIEAVFFAASGTKTFANKEARSNFRERWLGRFLTHDPDFVYVALDADNRRVNETSDVAGYLVGALDDPAHASRFSDLGYFQIFRSYTASFPAQLHVNLAEQVRGHGVGGRLIAAFVDDARQRGAPGVHVVTGEGARNVAFYAREGFDEVARTDWNGHTIVFLGRRL